MEYKTCVANVDKEYEGKVNHYLGDEYNEVKQQKKEACFEVYYGFLIPKYKVILQERLTAIKANGENYNRLEDLSTELTSLTTGAPKMVSEPGLMYLEAIMDYMKLLTDLP